MCGLLIKGFMGYLFWYCHLSVYYRRNKQRNRRHTGR